MSNKLKSKLYPPEISSFINDTLYDITVYMNEEPRCYLEVEKVGKRLYNHIYTTKNGRAIATFTLLVMGEPGGTSIVVDIKEIQTFAYFIDFPHERRNFSGNVFNLGLN